ncbi:hypothetical protein D9758_009608 [Tetrapyrgos nigripes]|uniref:NADH:flavin oxidoreductase/NADH oxidase N-terminal domain-containing protein n=1 Tax=Tetrapyrgos nigripes TaxID=182062 RepID=A0A8H5LMH2_9AGAR|nr:hypothetical protein D9758_009608 [Tetrapyrgos nigripes]
MTLDNVLTSNPPTLSRLTTQVNFKHQPSAIMNLTPLRIALYFALSLFSIVVLGLAAARLKYTLNLPRGDPLNFGNNFHESIVAELLATSILTMLWSWYIIHVIHKRREHGLVSSFRRAWIPLFILWVMWLVGAVIATFSLFKRLPFGVIVIHNAGLVRTTEFLPIDSTSPPFWTLLALYTSTVCFTNVGVIFWPSLFTPIKLGPYTLQHRVVLAPLTRLRSTRDTNVPQNPTMKEYYSQRASVPGTLLISEATFIAAKAGLFRHAPGIWSKEQIAAWKEITDAVHSKGSYIFLQLWALGRAADLSALQASNPSFELISSSDIPLSKNPSPRPRPLTTQEIAEYTSLYATAASNAVHKAGFDGVEIHGANGYLIDQFLQDVCNKRTDEYGGSVENRCRFALEVVQAVVDKVGEERTGIRIGPWTPFQEMGMKNPIPTFSYFISQLNSRFPNFAFIDVIEPRVFGGNSEPASQNLDTGNDFIRDIWLPRPMISAGNYMRETALMQTDEYGNKNEDAKKGQMIAFGRYFISNPDLPERLEKDIPLTPYNRSTFYLLGDTTGKGYTDYPFADEARL